MTGGEPSSCKLTQRRLSRGWTHTSSFSLPASSLTNKPPSDEQRERPDRLFRLTGKTPLVLLPSMPFSTHNMYHELREKTSPLFPRRTRTCHSFAERVYLEV